MKKMVFTAVMAAMIGAVSCGESNPQPTEGSRIGFALSFFRNVNKSVSPDENILVSPYSAGAALSMLAEGAEGETRVELDNALNGTLYKDERLSGGDDAVVESSNSLWISDNFSIRNSYVSLLQKDYDAFTDVLDFSDPSSSKVINNWCSEHTSGKITEIVDRLSPGTVMILINALYFNAPWENAFNPEMTHEVLFHGISSETKVPMMARKAMYNYGEYQGAKMIEIPYAGGRYAMYVVLPPEGMNLDSFIPYVGEKEFEMAISMLSPKEVALTMPKLKLETSLLLNRTLENMGVRTAFSGAADFTGISVSGPLAVDLVKQKCYIDVSEKGTEAAAVTSVQVRMTSVRPSLSMNIDRPFVFMIADMNTKDILFAGKIVNL